MTDWGYQGRVRTVGVFIASLWERHEMLEKALESIRLQTIGPVEARVVLGMPRIEAYNTAADMDSRFFTILDDDDIMLPTHLEALVETQTRTDADVVYSKVLLRNTETEQEKTYGRDHDPEGLREGNFIMNGYMYRTELFRELGGFPNHPFADWGLHVKALDAGATFAFTDTEEPTLIMNLHGDNALAEESLMSYDF